MYKEGCKEPAMVRQIQQALGIPADGNFGPQTKASVINFQMQYHLVADGIVGRKTLEEMGILDTDTKQNIIRTSDGLIIEKRHLPEGEFIRGEDGKAIQNDYLFGHHTAGWNNPFNVIDDWGRDSRGRVATEFVVGGQNMKNGDAEYDGRVAQAFPEGCQGWHLGNTGSRYMARHSVGIEVCGFGQLNNEFKNYVGVPAIKSQVTTLNEAFNGYVNWHKYSDAQLYALKRLILYIAERDNIDVRNGLIKWIQTDGVKKAFGFYQEAYEGKVKGFLLHCNVRRDKVDMFPQTELIDMLLSI